MLLHNFDSSSKMVILPFLQPFMPAVGTNNCHDNVAWPNKVQPVDLNLSPWHEVRAPNLIAIMAMFVWYTGLANQLK